MTAVRRSHQLYKGYIYIYKYLYIDTDSSVNTLFRLFSSVYVLYCTRVHFHVQHSRVLETDCRN